MTNHNILLADDDDDDCMLFKDALEELSIDVSLNTVNNGAELMLLLKRNLVNLPHILFLDLNMPRKSGIDCLSEIKQNENLRRLLVIIYSTSFDVRVLDQLYDNGADYYIRKPADFSDLKSVIHQAICIGGKTNLLQPPREKFVIWP
jgi:CheY-like chemotaxis protein